MCVQTTSTEGVLFYGRQQYPVYSHLAVSLGNASLHVSVVFAHPVSFSELYVTIGNALDDDRCFLTTVVCTAGFWRVWSAVCGSWTFRSAARPEFSNKSKERSGTMFHNEISDRQSKNMTRKHFIINVASLYFSSFKWRHVWK